jgi:hypothetical protein
MNFLQITTEDSWKGKPLGGPCYAGLPIDKLATIRLNDDIYMEFNMYMFVLEDLDYELRFSWGDCEWRDCPYKFRKDVWKTQVAQFCDKPDWGNIIGLIYNTNLNNDDAVLYVDNVIVKITDANLSKIKEFSNELKKIVIEFGDEAEELYIKQKDIIGWK